MNGTSGRTIQVEIPPSTVEAIDTYRQRMLELIGVELTESQIAAMLIHFGKNVDVGRAGGATFALPATVAPSVPRLPAGSTPPAPATRRSREKENGGRAKTAPARTCACGCGGKLSPRSRASARWLRGHNKRGVRADLRGRLRKTADEPETEVVWDGRGPLSRPWDRRNEE